MDEIDEPAFDDSQRTDPTAEEHGARVGQRIRELVFSEHFAVLCTEGEGQPYGSIVAFAFSENLDYAVFATPVATRKYRLLSENQHVAFVVDNRVRHPGNMMEVEAVTATGRAREIERGPEFDRGAGLLLARHPHFRSFVYASSSALFLIDIVRFFHVSRFQEVHQWVPPR